MLANRPRWRCRATCDVPLPATPVPLSARATLGTTLQPGTSGLPHGGQVNGKDAGLDVDPRIATELGRVDVLDFQALFQRQGEEAPSGPRDTVGDRSRHTVSDDVEEADVVSRVAQIGEKGGADHPLAPETGTAAQSAPIREGGLLCSGGEPMIRSNDCRLWTVVPLRVGSSTVGPSTA